MTRRNGRPVSVARRRRPPAPRPSPPIHLSSRSSAPHHSHFNTARRRRPHRSSGVPRRGARRVRRRSNCSFARARTRSARPGTAVDRTGTDWCRGPPLALPDGSRPGGNTTGARAPPPVLPRRSTCPPASPVRAWRRVARARSTPATGSMGASPAATCGLERARCSSTAARRRGDRSQGRSGARPAVGGRRGHGPGCRVRPRHRRRRRRPRPRHRRRRSSTTSS